jgi:hypothetical protein
MPGDRVHKIRVSHGTAEQIRKSEFVPTELRRIKRSLNGCMLHLTSRDIRKLVQWAIDVSLDTGQAS